MTGSFCRISSILEYLIAEILGISGFFQSFDDLVNFVQKR